MYKKLMVLAVSISSYTFAAINPAYTDSIVLESVVLNWVDGLSYAIDAQKIEAIENIRRSIKLLQYGINDDRPGVIARRYNFQNSAYTIAELVTVEEQYEARFSKLSKQQYDAAMAPLNQVLKDAKEDFIKLIKPFNKDMQGLKEFVAQLIEQSCQKRNRMNSYLREWAQCPEGREEEFFRRRVTSFAFLNTFYLHLHDYLGDLKKSCPKACRKYEELKRTHGRA